MVEIRNIDANGMTFRCREAGTAGEPVILLHGFPETSHMWLPLMDRLAAEGYRCLAPDQRGYSPGARPEGADHYRYIDTASDVVALADAWGAGRFHLVGHDWGAGCGWAVVALHPERLLSWSALSVPHVAAFGAAIRNDPDQRKRSEYVTFFQQPGAAEAFFSANDFAALKGIWSASAPDEVAEYLSVLTQSGALTAALNWYRGSRGIDPVDADVTFGDVTTPTLTIWGNQDVAIGRASVEAAAAYMRGPYTFVELGAGHWLIQEQPARVIDEVLAHLRRNGVA
ncbi:MAG: alpha/beta hydrolase [Chloroflexi bacterium]|nr:alpha/beta hydrolase [Chloroflexota bacterium]